MRKNQKFDSPIITPTTKAAEDELIDPAGIIERGFATRAQWEEISEKALALFKRGQGIAAKRGLILVDTKYEMGFDEDGVLTIGDEVHTPDSSRYWKASTYEERHAKGLEPESLDKEFFRLWLGTGIRPFDPFGSLRAGALRASLREAEARDHRRYPADARDQIYRPRGTRDGGTDRVAEGSGHPRADRKESEEISDRGCITHVGDVLPIFHFFTWKRVFLFFI